jgi:hypothetical protein
LTAALSHRSQYRLGVALVGVSIVLAVVVFNSGGEKQPSTRVQSLGAGVTALDLELASGQVKIVPTTGKPSITVDGDEGLDVTKAGTTRVRCERAGGCGSPRVVIRLPESAAVRARVDDGTLTVDKMRGPSVDLRSEGGDLNAFSVQSKNVALESTSGEIHVSLAGIADSLTTRSTTGGIYITVPYDYDNDGYDYTARSSGQVDLDITQSKQPTAKKIAVESRTGNIGLAQRYPNMS